MVLKYFSKFVRINVTKWYQKKYIRGNMPFLNKELSSAHTKKNTIKKSLSQKKILSK